MAKKAQSVLEAAAWVASSKQAKYTRGVADWVSMDPSQLPDGELKAAWGLVKMLVGRRWLLGNGPTEEGGQFHGWGTVAKAYGIPESRCVCWTYLFRTHNKLPIGLRKEDCVFLPPQADPEMYDEMRPLLQLALKFEKATDIMARMRT